MIERERGQYMKSISSKKNLIRVVIPFLIIGTTLSIVSCKGLPYKEEDILCDYPDLNCLYYVKNEYKEYKYSDYIIDDVTNGDYKNSTPSISDYKNGSGMLDYDIAAYVEARTDFMLKKELIDKYEISVTEICAEVRDDYFRERNALVYFYDKETKKSTLLHDTYVSNISYDDEIPMIWFDVDEGNGVDESLRDRKILLSDIIAANSTLEGYMRIYLGADRTRYQFFMDERVENDNSYIATSSDVATD